MVLKGRVEADSSGDWLKIKSGNYDSTFKKATKEYAEKKIKFESKTVKSAKLDAAERATAAFESIKTAWTADATIFLDVTYFLTIEIGVFRPTAFERN